MIWRTVSHLIDEVIQLDDGMTSSIQHDTIRQINFYYNNVYLSTDKRDDWGDM